MVTKLGCRSKTRTQVSLLLGHCSCCPLEKAEGHPFVGSHLWPALQTGFCEDSGGSLVFFFAS